MAARLRAVGLRRPQGLEAHCRLMVTERTLSASLAGRRSSHLGALAALLLRYPLASASMTGRHLGLSKRGGTGLIDALVRAG